MNWIKNVSETILFLSYSIVSSFLVWVAIIYVWYRENGPSVLVSLKPIELSGVHRRWIIQNP